MNLIGEPNLREYTEEELHEMIMKGGELMGEGKMREAMQAIDDIPISADVAQSLKEDYGINWLIERNMNLSEAVRQYGREWLYS